MTSVSLGRFLGHVSFLFTVTESLWDCNIEQSGLVVKQREGRPPNEPRETAAAAARHGRVFTGETTAHSLLHYLWPWLRVLTTVRKTQAQLVNTRQPLAAEAALPEGKCQPIVPEAQNDCILGKLSVCQS